MLDISKDILIKAAEGDINAFEQLYRQSSGFVYNVAYRIVNRRQAAEDVTQEVFLKIYKSLKHFRFASSFKTWVYRITVNTAINSYRKYSKPLNSPESFNDSFKGHRHSELSDDPAAKQARGQLVEWLLSNLPLKQRVCLVLREIQGLNYKEIAQTLKININTVRSRLKRAREALIVQGQKEVVKNEL